MKKLAIVISLVLIWGTQKLTGYQLIRSCQQKEDFSYRIVGLECDITNHGLYTFNGNLPQLKYVVTITVNQITEHSFVKITNPGELKKISVHRGICANIDAPRMVKVYVNGHPCGVERNPDSVSIISILPMNNLKNIYIFRTISNW